MKTDMSLLRDERADAVVEAAILFPIIMMIFMALIMLAMYLPLSANLQRAVQMAATTVSVMQSDTGYRYDPAGGAQGFDYTNLKNVYPALFDGLDESEKEIARQIVVNAAAAAIGQKGEEPTVDCTMKNYLVYKEVSVTAEQTVQIPLSLSFIGLGDSFTMKRTAVATVQNSEDFVRTIDLLADACEETGLTDAVCKALDKVVSFFDFGGDG